MFPQTLQREKKSSPRKSLRSPIKLCVNLKDIVIAPPSSSSEETNLEMGLSVIPPNKTTEQRMHADDNAVFDEKSLRDVSNDLFLTDDSEAEPESPIKRARSNLTASIRKTTESLQNKPSSTSISLPSKSEISPDPTPSPVSCPKASSTVSSSSEVNFSTAVTSTPSPVIIEQNLPSKPPAFPSLSPLKTKKKKRVLGRSVTSSN